MGDPKHLGKAIGCYVAVMALVWVSIAYVIFHFVKKIW